MATNINSLNIQDATAAGTAVYAGAQLVGFGIAEMPPNTKIYVYCNGVNITSFCAPNTSGSKIGDTITTNSAGTAAGWLYIPSDDGDYKFLIGEILLTFSDSADGVEKSKYISETILYNHGYNLVDTEQGGTISLRQTIKFRTDPVGSSAEANKTLSRLDPLAQTFIVDGVKYPYGIYLTGINLFVYSKDETLPIGVELRPVTAGKPSTTEYLSGSYVLRAPNEVNTYDNVAKNCLPTPFTFNHPIYLRPGEYAFCVLTKSDKYLLLSAKSGDGKIVKQPFAGRLFKAQNTGDWVGDSNEDLAFLLRKAAFTTGTVTIEAKTLPITNGVTYNRLRLLSTAVNFGDVGSATYKASTTLAGSRTKSDFKEITPGVNFDLNGRQILTEEGDLTIQLELTTKSKDISPMLDQQLLAAQVFRTNITEYSEAISVSELKPNHGTATCRYLSKVVELADGFDSTGLEVKVNVNRKTGTDIDVFCRTLSRNDTSVSNGIFDRYWKKMPLVYPVSKTFAGTSDTFSQETYRILEPNLEYTANAGPNTNITANFEDFAYYQVKVVMYSSDPINVPRLKSLSATSLI